MSAGISLVRGCLGSKGVACSLGGSPQEVGSHVIETIGRKSEEVATRSNGCDSGRSCDDDATGGDDCGVILGNGSMSHRRGMRSSDDGMVFLTGGNGMLSGCWVTSIDAGKDGGKGMLIGSGVSFIGMGGLYCSIDKYSCQCIPQGTRGSGGDSTHGGSTDGGLGGVGINGGANGDGSTRGGNGILGATGGNGTTSLGRDEDG